MDSILFWLGALVVVSILSPVLKLVIAALAGRQIGQQALAQQPDNITLTRIAPEAFKNAVAVRKLVDPLVQRGFHDAGSYAVDEMAGLKLTLLAHPEDSFYAAVYEHPQAGTWFDLVSRFQDGTSYTASSSRPTGLEPRPGHAMVNMHGTDPAQALERARAMRPRRPCVAASVREAPTVFTQSYAESTAWRKGHGISTKEVVNVATRKVA